MWSIASEQVAPPRRRSVDNSSTDWAMCCKYFEDQPQASVECALQELTGKFAAVRANQKYYEELTVSKAKKHCEQKAPPQQGVSMQKQIVGSRQDKATPVAEAVPASAASSSGDRPVTMKEVHITPAHTISTMYKSHRRSMSRTGSPWGGGSPGHLDSL